MLTAVTTHSRQQRLKPRVSTQWIEIGVDRQIADFRAPFVDSLLQPRQRLVGIVDGERYQCEDDGRDVLPLAKRIMHGTADQAIRSSTHGETCPARYGRPSAVRAV